MSQYHTDVVSGLLDGQLTGIRLWLARRHISACPVCAAEYRRQQHVRRMLQANPSAAVMSDSPEFFWSKVKTEIQRRGAERVETPTPRLALADWLEQHQWAVASAVASLIAVIGVLAFALAFRGTHTVVASVPAPVVHVATVTPAPVVHVVASEPVAVVASVPAPDDVAQVEQLKTPIPHTAATAFDSEDAGVTVIWVTGLPWTADMNEMKTEFANLDT